MAKLTDLPRREQESIFELWDSDQEGYITQADLESRAQAWPVGSVADWSRGR